MNQQNALSILKSGANVFLTGSAGTGKTYVLNQYVEYLKDRKVPVAITASTGIAATHLNGMTIHAWSGMGVKNSLTTKDLESLKGKKYLQKQLEESKVLIIDEISMLHRVQFEIVNRILQFFKGNELPFGGIQVIVSGDFFQLPPVGAQGETNREKFAFMSPAWVNAGFSICYLTEQYRQTDHSLNTILNEIRSGAISSNSVQMLNQAADTIMKDGWEPTQLYTHNYDVDRENKKQLATLEGRRRLFSATTKGNPKLIDMLKKFVLTDEHLELKVGAKVMFIKNNTEAGYHNGTLGKIVEFDSEGLPIVETIDQQKIKVEQEEWSTDNDQGKSLAKFIQIPLRLAWAITVHKSQGVTLEAAEIDLSKTFEKGQGYVALSRLKELKNLRLLGYNEAALQVDELAYKADRRFQQLSSEAQAIIDPARLEREARNFISKCGGLTTDREIQKHKQRKKEKKGPKKSTYEITKEYIDRGMQLSEIAEERGMTLGTIMGHLIRIKETFPETNLEPFRPDEATMNSVEIAYRALMMRNEVKEDGSVSQKAMFEQMNGKIDYNTIKLALTYIDA